MRLLPMLALLAGCTLGRAPRDAPPPSAGVQAALAIVTVENRTATELTISFRTVGASRGSVVVGRVAAGATRRMAPLPAVEPVVLLAARPDSAVLALPVRTFAIDQEWLWVIPGDARFER